MDIEMHGQSVKLESGLNSEHCSVWVLNRWCTLVVWFRLLSKDIYGGTTCNNIKQFINYIS